MPTPGWARGSSSPPAWASTLDHDRISRQRSTPAMSGSKPWRLRTALRPSTPYRSRHPLLKGLGFRRGGTTQARGALRGGTPAASSRPSASAQRFAGAGGVDGGRAGTGSLGCHTRAARSTRSGTGRPPRSVPGGLAGAAGAPVLGASRHHSVMLISSVAGLPGLGAGCCARTARRCRGPGGARWPRRSGRSARSWGPAAGPPGGPIAQPHAWLVS